MFSRIYAVPIWTTFVCLATVNDGQLRSSYTKSNLVLKVICDQILVFVTYVTSSAKMDIIAEKTVSS